MIWLILLPYILWLFYLAVMNLMRAYENKTISKLALWLGYPILIMGVLLDFIVNMTIMTIIFFEIPKEWLVTKRLQRHIKANKDWRGKLAYLICHHLLNAFDPDGDHCV